jgi:predicted amidophosphoribosyltransferase
MEQDAIDGPMECPLCNGTIQPSTATCDGCGRKISEIAREYEQEQRDSNNTRHH